ncbi:hypothetical protein HNY73_010512 [Argiope bruennichi]|uniref:Uncharacterized protein n=1 Tax=Argiope bruennichi TaxID=94029 RepID=A0A8T0F662_ARGBR|nr:hypothetical protein HNY73_010512 [Argiope bruennichi]
MAYFNTPGNTAYVNYLFLLYQRDRESSPEVFCKHLCDRESKRNQGERLFHTSAVLYTRKKKRNLLNRRKMFGEVDQESGQEREEERVEEERNREPSCGFGAAEQSFKTALFIRRH